MISEYNDKKGRFRLYFVGIGGISMSALARIMKDKGFYVSGCDRSESRITRELEEEGISVNRAGELARCDLAVVSSAVPSDDPAVTELKKLGKVTVSRAWLLARLCESFGVTIGVAGTHGKTTCTCLLAHVFDCARKAFAMHAGGEDSDFGNEYSCGDDYFITEICEYKRNIAHFSPDVGVVLNVDDDHEESFGSFENIAEEFRAYVCRSKVGVINYDDVNLNICDGVTFSFDNPAADFYCKDVRFDGKVLECAVFGHGDRLFEIESNFLRRHDAYNVAAATAAAVTVGIKPENIAAGIASFRGIKRRNEYLGSYKGKPVFTDYAHHPKQIELSVAEYKERFGASVRFLFQSHTYSRTARLIDDFVAALSLCNDLRLFETYGAREKYDEAGSGKKLAYKLKNSIYYQNDEGILSSFEEDNEKVSAYVVLGAGDLYDKVLKFLVKSK